MDWEVTAGADIDRHPMSDSYNPVFVTEPGLVAYAYSPNYSGS